MEDMGKVEATIAAQQHGIVTRAQLQAAGFTQDVIDHRIQSGRLVRLHRGVYLVGVVAPPFAHELAACLACGPAAVLSHRSAAVLWQLVKPRARSTLEVTIPAGYRRRPGIKAYRIGTLQRDEITCLRGVPITSAARTLYDLAGRLGPRQMERAVGEALALTLTTPAELLTMVARQAGRRGAGRLRAALDAGGPLWTRSEAEERFLGLIRRHDIPLPAVNSQVGGHEVDFYWADQRLAVEVDGRAFHISPRAFEEDRSRDSDLAGLGVRVSRVTWRQITDEPAAVARKLIAALAWKG